MKTGTQYKYALAAFISLLLFIPTSKLLAADAARVAGNLRVEGLVFSGDSNNTVITNPSQMGPWGTNAESLYFGLTGGNIGIGTATPDEQLELTGNLKLPATTGTTGQIRQGTFSLLHTYGTGNTFVGHSAGDPAKLTGTHNTGFGFAALFGNTLGYKNIATGSYALNNNTIGNENTANGYGTLTSNISGNFNTASGSSALTSNTTGSYNAAYGRSSLGLNTIGSENTAYGDNTLHFNESGVGNTAVGAFSGGGTMFAANISGSYNTFLGHSAGPGTSTQLTKAIAIGYNARVSQDNSMVLGGTGPDAVKVGIGTTTPGATLDALRLIRVLGSTLTAGEWPTSGIGLELAHDSAANKGYIVSYNRTTPAWGSLDIQASTVTIGGGTSSGNLTVSGTLNANNIASGTWSGTAISPAKGGTGLNSSGTVAGSIFKTTDTGTWGTLAPGSDGQILKMSGGTPTWSGSGADATSLFRVLGTAGITWPSSGEGIEIAHDSTANKGFIQSYDRGGAGSFGALDINASTVNIGGTPGNLSVSGVISGNGSGLTNVTPVQGIAGPALSTITGGSSSFVFVGPTVTVTTTASQHIVGSMTAVLGTTNSITYPYFSFDFGICYRQNATLDAPVTLTPNYTTADMTKEVGRKTYASSMTRVPGAGTWEIGYCVRNSSTADFDDNDFVNGWIMTTN